jgi:hypothetical protein
MIETEISFDLELYKAKIQTKCENIQERKPEVLQFFLS